MNKRNIIAYLMLGNLVLLQLSCQAGNTISDRFEVVEQTDTVFGGNEDNGHEWATFTVDVPVNGPKVLVDSVMTFINKELYDACESNAHFNEKVGAFGREQMYSDDAENLLSHYMENYKPLMRDSLWRVFGLTMKMEAQTEKYVTYGLEFYYCGAGCSSQKEYYTFDKNDGHQIKEIISHENLVRFFEDYPEYNTIGADSWSGYPGWVFSPEYRFDNSCYGLLEECFTLVIEGCGNHFLLTDFSYSQIFSYLSPETQALVEQNGEEKAILPAYQPERSEDGEVWMEVDTVNYALLGYISAAGGPLIDTLKYYDSALEAYPKRVHSIASYGSTIFLFIYSFGHLLYLDEAMTCIFDEDSLKPAKLFKIEDKRDSIVSCMWYDQPLEASEGFPFDTFDENRFGLHYDPFTKRLYSPILESHDPDSEYANTSCLRYTGRFEVLQFNGKEFVLVDDDGAWWLNPDLRNYKRTISNRITNDGIEQIDLMPDGTYRHAIWKGAKTLDDLRKKPDEVKISKEMFK